MFLSFLTLLVFVSSRKIAAALDPLSGIALSRINFNVNNEYIYIYMYVSRQLERVIRAIMKRDYLEWSNRITAPRYTYNSARKMRNTRGVKNPLT